MGAIYCLTCYLEHRIIQMVGASLLERHPLHFYSGVYTMPGEPFVQYGWHLEKAFGDRATVIPVGFANGCIGYLCTKEAYQVGGYEPSTSLIASEAAEILLNALIELGEEALTG